MSFEKRRNSFVPNQFGSFLAGLESGRSRKRPLVAQKLFRRGREARTDAVAPIVTVGETAARPADDRRPDLAHRVDQRFPDATDIGDLRVLADPDAVVNDAAEMLDEVAMNRSEEH